MTSVRQHSTPLLQYQLEQQQTECRKAAWRTYTGTRSGRNSCVEGCAAHAEESELWQEGERGCTACKAWHGTTPQVQRQAGGHLVHEAGEVVGQLDLLQRLRMKVAVYGGSRRTLLIASMASACAGLSGPYNPHLVGPQAVHLALALEGHSQAPVQVVRLEQLLFAMELLRV